MIVVLTLQVSLAKCQTINFITKSSPDTMG
jgi:hypothetical protein